MFTTHRMQVPSFMYPNPVLMSVRVDWGRSVLATARMSQANGTHRVGDVVVHGELALEVVLDETRKSGRNATSRQSAAPSKWQKNALCPSLDTSECTSLPLATRNELERARRDLLAGRRDSAAT